MLSSKFRTEKIIVNLFQKSEVASLDDIFQRIKDAIYKNGIRTTEFFRDHDKLRSGVITKNQVHVHVLESDANYHATNLNCKDVCTFRVVYCKESTPMHYLSMIKNFSIATCIYVLCTIIAFLCHNLSFLFVPPSSSVV